MVKLKNQSLGMFIQTLTFILLKLNNSKLKLHLKLNEIQDVDEVYDKWHFSEYR